jgi:hypothetical protein
LAAKRIQTYLCLAQDFGGVMGIPRPYREVKDKFSSPSIETQCQRMWESERGGACRTYLNIPSSGLILIWKCIGFSFPSGKMIEMFAGSDSSAKSMIESTRVSALSSIRKEELQVSYPSEVSVLRLSSC